MRRWVFQHLMTILTLEECYFKRIASEKKLKLTDELLHLNFERYSPFPHPSIYAFTSEHSCYVWFAKRAPRRQFVVPEALILFYRIRQQYDNVILLLEGEGRDAVLVVKEGELEASVMTTPHHATLLEQLQEKYGIDVVVRKDREQRAALAAEATDRFPLAAMARIFYRGIDVRQELIAVSGAVAYPLAVVLVGGVLIDATTSYILNRQLDAQKGAYLAAKEANDPYRTAMQEKMELESNVAMLSEREFSTPDLRNILHGLTRVAAEHNATLLTMNAGLERTVVTFVSAKDNVVILNALTKAGLFDSIRVVSSRKLKRSGRNMLTYEGIPGRNHAG